MKQNEEMKQNAVKQLTLWTVFPVIDLNWVGTFLSPLTGRGRPVDDLDRHCRMYKQCQLCARRIHGAECIGRVKLPRKIIFMIK